MRARALATTPWKEAAAALGCSDAATQASGASRRDGAAQMGPDEVVLVAHTHFLDAAAHVDGTDGAAASTSAAAAALSPASCGAADAARDAQGLNEWTCQSQPQRPMR